MKSHCSQACENAFLAPSQCEIFVGCSDGYTGLFFYKEVLDDVMWYRLCLKLCARIVSYVSDGRTTSREEILLEVLFIMYVLVVIF